jgi:hypothetical protein
LTIVAQPGKVGKMAGCGFDTPGNCYKMKP